MTYHAIIQAELERAGVTDIEPAWVEAWMRLEYGTLDHLPRSTFKWYIEITREIEAAEPGSSAKLAATI
jgi:hypothetical protein